MPIAFLSHLTFKVSKVCEGNFGYKAGIYALLLRKHPVYTMTTNTLYLMEFQSMVSLLVARCDDLHG